MIFKTVAAGSAIFLMFAGFANAQGPAAAVSAAPVAPCDGASTGKAYNDAVIAYTGQAGPRDMAKVKSLLDPVILLCGEAPETFAARVLRSDIALQEKDYPMAVLVLNPVPRPGRGALGVHAAFIMLRLLAAANEAPSFARERGNLIANSGHLLTSAPLNGSLIESFTTPAGDKVMAYRVNFSQGSLSRRYEFLVEPKADLVMPMSLAVGTDTLAPRPLSAGNAKTFSLDHYSCDGQVAVSQFSTAGDPPSYDQVKAAVLTRLAVPGVTTRRAQPDANCAAETAIAPGL